MKTIVLDMLVILLLLSALPYTQQIEIISINTANPSQQQYDINQSKQFQKYCVLTHCDQEALIKWNCKICPSITELQQRTYITNSITDVLLFAGYHPKLNAIIIVFRGTQPKDVKNWVEDFTFKQVGYPRCKDCKVHEGFYLDYLSVAEQLKTYVQKLRQKYSTCGIYTLGSSMGGALATIAALQMQLVLGNVKQLHVFGCPRTGDQNFVQFLSQKIGKIRRVIHNKDIVPHVPLVSQNYFHAAYEIWFDQNMQKYQICNSSGQDPKCSNSLSPNYSVQDHISYWVKPVSAQIC